MSQIANAEISVTRENATSSDPGFVLSPFLEKGTLTFSKGFSGQIIIS